MPSRMTVLKWEEDERETIKLVSSAQLYQAAVKPIVDDLKNLARDVASVGLGDTTTTDEVRLASEMLVSLRKNVEALPDTEEKSQILERMRVVDEKFKEALSIS